MHVVDGLPRDYRLRGSFAYGDFHYDTKDNRTLSDLDLLYPCSEVERHRKAQAVQSRLQERGIRVRVSVQPANHHAALTLADSRYVVIGEYLRHCYEVRTDVAASSYLRAKTALGIVRRLPDERYSDTAAAMNTAASRLALDVKVGMRQNFSARDAADVIRDARIHAPEISLMLELLADDPPGPDAYAYYVNDLDRRPSISPWLRELMTRLVLAARSLTRDSPAPVANSEVSGDS